MTTVSIIALLTSFAAGFVSFLSPCVLPLVPGYVSYIAGHSLRTPASPTVTGINFVALRLSIFFVLGFSTVFVVLGASATALGQLFLSYRYQGNILAGAIVIVFGLLMMGLVRWPWLQREFRIHPDLPGGRPAAAYILGLAFAFGWTPCIGPVLGTILTTSAVSATVSEGIVSIGVQV
jgi:cytochrome c-type biogenesis protein